MATEEATAIMPEQYCLRWHNHTVNLVSTVYDEYNVSVSKNSSVLDDNLSFTDVTLACCDGVRLQAHRLILAASSPYFCDLFKTVLDQSAIYTSYPFLILNDVQSSEMSLLLEYIYKGEVSVSREEFDRFINVAKGLQVRGLTDITAPKNNEQKNQTIPGKDYFVPHEESASKKCKQEKMDTEDPITVKSSNNAKDYAPEDTKFSYSPQFSDAMKETFRSRSSTPVSRKNSPALKYLKEEVAIKSDYEFDKNLCHNLDNELPHKRQRSPPANRGPHLGGIAMIPTPVLSPSIALYQDLLDKRPHRQSSPTKLPYLPAETYHQPFQHKPIPHGNVVHPAFMTHLNNLYNKVAPPPQYPEEDCSNRDASPPSHQPIPFSLTNPHSAKSPPSNKKRRLGPPFFESVVPTSLREAAHYHPLALPFALPHLQPSAPQVAPYTARNIPEIPGLGGLAVKTNLIDTEEEENKIQCRDKMINGTKAQDYSPYVPTSSPLIPTSVAFNPRTFGYNDPHSLHNNTQRNASPSPPVTSSSANVNTHPDSNTFSTSHASAFPRNSNNNIAHNNVDDNHGSLINGTSLPSCTTEPEVSGFSNSKTSYNPNGPYGKPFVNYGVSPKPEWKRYKQYSKNDLQAAIQDVQSGITALQASRKHKVPSRTLYDKIKKLGISTTTRRNISTGSKLRGLPNTDQYGPDHHEGVSTSDDVTTFLPNNATGVSLKLDCDGPQVGSVNATVPELSRFDISRPHSEDSISTTTNDALYPLDLQISKSAVSGEGPSGNIKSSSLDQIHHHHPFASKSILDLLPRQNLNNLQEHLTNESPIPFLNNMLIDPCGSYAFLNQFKSESNLMAPQSSGGLNENNLLTESNPQFNYLLQQHSRTENQSNNNESEDDDDDDMELIVDNNDHEQRSPNPDVETRDIKEKSCVDYSSPPHANEQRSDNNDTAYVSHSTNNEPSSSDSPSSSCFTAADSGRDSNNDTSPTSDSEIRNQARLSVNLSQASPETRNSTSNIRVPEISPKVSETSTSGSEVSPLQSDKSSVGVDSDSNMSAERIASKSSGGSYKMVSDIGLCSQVRPLDLRENSSAISIPQESA